MVRFCIVPKCKNSDQNILSHRFPKKKELQKKWIQNLEINHIPLEELEKYVVCTLHFDDKDYRNSESRYLNVTACPKLYGITPRKFEDKIRETHVDKDKDVMVFSIHEASQSGESTNAFLIDEVDKNDGDEIIILSNANEIGENEEFDSVETEKYDIGCQTEELYYDDDDIEYSKLTKKQLINMVKESKLKITELEMKIDKLQNARDKLVKTMEIFQSI